jgi:penicillin-binding protein 1A
MVPGIVLRTGRESAEVRIGAYTGRLGCQDVQWVGRKDISRVLQTGDVAMFTIQAVDRETKTLKIALDRIPQAQAALIAIENQTGAVKVMVGGFDFRTSKFNRSTQALRQGGSIFKPFTYIAALENGFSPSDTVLDAPVSFRDGLGRLYEPMNEDGEYKGLIPIDQALYQSRNVPTIRLADSLGIDKVIAVAHRFGIRRKFPPYLPVCLGAGELTLMEITSAFSTFANGGVRATPYFINRVENYNGVVLEQHSPRVEEVIAADTAGKMVYMLRKVVERGTAAPAVREAGDLFNRPLGGKTGTTNDFTDSWFVGFSPQITAGVWAGRDEKRPLGDRIFGSSLALPIWIDFMKDVLPGLSPEEFENCWQPPAEEVIGDLSS